MSTFIGKYDAKADVKGRIFIPSSYRKLLPEGDRSKVVMRKDADNDCLVLYPGTVWENEIETLRARLNKWNKEQQQVFRQFVLDAERIEMDASGRILIPKRYMQLVDIESDVRFLGVDDTIEIWAKEKLEKPLVDPDDFSTQLQRLME